MSTGKSPVTWRRHAADLFKRLRDRFAPGGLLHYGQGKWCPGEPLPRWALSCYWRKDGVPTWKREALIADETVNYGQTVPEAQRFVVARLALCPFSASAPPVSRFAC